MAKYYFKLLAIKDEYEVARLYTDGEFLKRVQQTFDGDYKIRFHLAPPIFSKADPVTGEVEKTEFGPWLMSAAEQKRTGIIIGRDYPAPIVDHAQARRVALDRYATAKSPQASQAITP